MLPECTLGHSIQINHSIRARHSTQIDHSIRARHSIPINHSIRARHSIPINHSIRVGHSIQINHSIRQRSPSKLPISHPLLNTTRATALGADTGMEPRRMTSRPPPNRPVVGDTAAVIRNRNI